MHLFLLFPNSHRLLPPVHHLPLFFLCRTRSTACHPSDLGLEPPNLKPPATPAVPASSIIDGLPLPFADQAGLLPSQFAVPPPSSHPATISLDVAASKLLQRRPVLLPLHLPSASSQSRCSSSLHPQANTAPPLLFPDKIRHSPASRSSSVVVDPAGTPPHNISSLICPFSGFPSQPARRTTSSRSQQCPPPP